MSDLTKVYYAVDLVSRLERMKEEGVVCDFTIKVGDKSYPVHRTVLVAVAPYFEALFSSKMKEAQQGFIEMKNLEVNAFEKSLKYIYTGSTEVTMDSSEHILHIAELFQLEGLKNICFQFLFVNLSANNCLYVANLAVTYDRPYLKEAAEDVIIANLDVIIHSESFLSICKSDLLCYISNADYQISWKAVVIWIEGRDDISEILEAMDLKKFPFKYLFETVLEEPCIQKSTPAKCLVINELFSDIEVLESGLNCGNCIPLKMITLESVFDEKVSDVIDRFIKDNFEEITQREEFCSLTEGVIMYLFKSQELYYYTETVKWEAAVTWVRHDLKNRKKLFLTLFNTINLGELPAKFLRDKVREEMLVKESRKCCDLLLGFFITNAVQAEQCHESNLRLGHDVHSVSEDEENEQGAVGGMGKHETLSGGKNENWSVILPMQPQNGRMRVKLLPDSLPGWKPCKTVEITYYFPAGEIEGMSYNHTRYIAYAPNVTECRVLLQRAFQSYQTFQLEFFPYRDRGQIIWADIPHITEGPERNGYPDVSYIERLRFAMKAKDIDLE